MRTIEPSPERIQEFLVAAEGTSPITMLNLLRYREQADYAGHPDETPCSGREAYRRYAEGVVACLASVGGTIAFAGGALATVIAPDDERWDDVLLVQYPSAQALFTMISSDAYRAIGHHRSAALEDSRLVALSPGAPTFQR